LPTELKGGGKGIEVGGREGCRKGNEVGEEKKIYKKKKLDLI